MKDSPDNSRRKFLKGSAAVVAAIPLSTLVAHKHAFAKAEAEEGHAHDYVHDAADASDHEAFQDDARCDNCAFWAGEEADGWGGCHHPDFRDVLVRAEGWCSVWAG